MVESQSCEQARGVLLKEVTPDREICARRGRRGERPVVASEVGVVAVVDLNDAVRALGRDDGAVVVVYQPPCELAEDPRWHVRDRGDAARVGVNELALRGRKHSASLEWSPAAPKGPSSRRGFT